MKEGEAAMSLGASLALQHLEDQKEITALRAQFSAARGVIEKLVEAGRAWEAWDLHVKECPNCRTFIFDPEKTPCAEDIRLWVKADDLLCGANVPARDFLSTTAEEPCDLAHLPEKPCRKCGKRSEVLVRGESAKNEKPATSLTGCARCGGDHDVHYRPFTRGCAVAEFWATCPTTGEPILMNIQEKRPSEEEE